MANIKMTKEQEAAGNLFLDAVDGDVRARTRLVEAISSSDLPVQLRPTMTLMAEQGYEEVTSVWTEYAKKETTPDFESHRSFLFEWGDEYIPSKKDGKKFNTGGLAAVGELAEYPALTFSATPNEIKTRKNGVRVPISWEAIVRSGNFGLVQKAMAEMGRRAKRQENYEAASQLVSEEGLNKTNFNSGNKNVISKNPELTLESLEKAVMSLGIVHDEKGNRIAAPTKFNLLVPSALKPLADALVGIQKFTVKDTAKGLEYEKPNVIAGRIAKVIEIPEFSIIGGEKADKAWFLLPTTDFTRPGVVNVFLEGYDTPQVFVRKTHDGAPEAGDFDHDAYDTKIRHVVAGGMISTVAMLASDGSGS